MDRLLREHAAAAGGPTVSLLTAHSHSHGDHLASNDQFRGRPNTTIIPPGRENVKAFFGLPDWPDGKATVDLGNRVVDVIPHAGGRWRAASLRSRIVKPPPPS